MRMPKKRLTLCLRCTTQLPNLSQITGQVVAVNRTRTVPTGCRGGGTRLAKSAFVRSISARRISNIGMPWAMIPAQYGWSDYDRTLAQVSFRGSVFLVLLDGIRLRAQEHR